MSTGARAVQQIITRLNVGHSNLNQYKPQVIVCYAISHHSVWHTLTSRISSRPFPKPTLHMWSKPILTCQIKMDSKITFELSNTHRITKSDLLVQNTQNKTSCMFISSACSCLASYPQPISSNCLLPPAAWKAQVTKYYQQQLKCYGINIEHNVFGNYNHPTKISPL